MKGDIWKKNKYSLKIRRTNVKLNKLFFFTYKNCFLYNKSYFCKILYLSSI